MTACHETSGELEGQAFGSAHLTERAFREQDPHWTIAPVHEACRECLGGGLFESDEFRPAPLATAYVRPIEIGRRGRRSLRRAQQLHLRLRERAPALLVIAVTAR